MLCSLRKFTYFCGVITQIIEPQTMAKIQKISQTITPFAGVYFTNREFNRCGLSQLIDKELGVRTSAGYRYSDIFRSWFDIFFCGGDVAEDIAQHLRPSLESLPGNKVPSPDTLLRRVKELAVKNTEVVSSTGKRYQFNINKNINELNIKFLIMSGQLKKNKSYDFDCDNQIIAHEKFDAKKNYKKTPATFRASLPLATKWSISKIETATPT